VYKIYSSSLDRLGSGVWVSASFQIYAFNNRGMSWVWREIIWAGNVCGDGIIHPRGNVQEKCTTLVTDSRNERRATEPKTFIYSSVEAKKNNNVITFDRQSEVIRSHWSEWDQYDTKRSAVCIDMRRRMLLRAVFFAVTLQLSACSRQMTLPRALAAARLRPTV